VDEQPRVGFYVVDDLDGEPVFEDQTDDVREVAREVARDVVTHDGISSMGVRVKIEGMEALAGIDPARAEELAERALEATHKQLELAREVSERDAEVEKARIRAAERVAVRQESDRLRRFFDARVEADVRSSSAPRRAIPAPTTPSVPGRPLPVRREGESLKKHQERLSKARRTSGRREPKPEPTALEKLQKRVGL
jgi:hypothetical protein